MEKIFKVALAIAIKAKKNDYKAHVNELETVLKREVGDYFIGVRLAKTGGVFNDLGFNEGDFCTCYLIFQSSPGGKVFERQSIEDLLEDIKLEYFEIKAISHTPYIFVEYK